MFSPIQLQGAMVVEMLHLFAVAPYDVGDSGVYGALTSRSAELEVNGSLTGSS